MTQQHAILFVDHAPALGGAERSLLLHLKHLDRERFRPILACNPGSLADAANALGVEVKLIDMPQLRGRPDALKRLYQGGQSLAQLARSEDVAIVHSNVMRSSFYATIAAWRANRTLIWHVRDIHALGQPGGIWYPALMCLVADRKIAITRAVAAKLPCRGSVRVIPNGLDIDAYDPTLDPEPVRAELGIPVDAPLVGIVGRVWPWKGQSDFLRAALEVAHTHPHVYFAIVGDPLFESDHTYMDQLHALTNALGLADRVVFTGHREDVQRMLAAIDIVVHCSKAEPFGRVLIEAMAMQRPIVAYTDGGVPEVVADGETGLLVSPGDIGALAQAICTLLDDPERAQALGHAGRIRVTTYFDAPKTTRQIEKLYEELIAG